MMSTRNKYGGLMKNFSKMVAVVLMSVIPSFAMAQTTGATGNQASTAYNSVEIIQPGYGAGASGGTGTQGVRYSGSWGNPTGTAAIGSPYAVSANPCALANGVSMVYGPVGASGTLSHVEHGCTYVRDAGAMNALGQKGMALNDLCIQETSADAFFHTWGMICPGAKKPEKYKLEDLRIPGLKGSPVVAVLDPYTAQVLNVSQSPILGPYMRQQQVQPTVVAMMPVSSGPEKQGNASDVAKAWAKRSATNSKFEQQQVITGVPGAIVK